MNQEQLERMAGQKFILLKHLPGFYSPSLFEIVPPDDWIKNQYSIQVTVHNMSGGPPVMRRVTSDFDLEWFTYPDFFFPLQWKMVDPATGQYL